MVWGILYGTLWTPYSENCLNPTAYQSSVADHVHPFMSAVYPFSDGYFQQDNTPCHKAQISSDWLLNMTMSWLYQNWPPHSPVRNPIEHLWDVVEQEICIMDVQPTNPQQLRDAIMSIWPKISQECFQHLVESMPWRIKTVLKAKEGPTGTSKMYLIKWPVSVCLYVYIQQEK